MYFCPNCNNVFDIIKGPAEPIHTGGKNKDILDMKISDFNDLEFNIEELWGGKKNGDEETDTDIYDQLLKKVINNEKIDKKDIDRISLDDLVQSNIYKKLKLKQKQYVYNKIQDQLPLSKKKVFNENDTKKNIDKAYFICNNCGYRKPIKKNTLIFSKVASDVAKNYSSSDVTDMKNSDILPRTRKYICPNKSCESHIDPHKREAVFFRMNNTFNIKYICQTCDTVF